jgi:hypothetical protein
MFFLILSSSSYFAVSAAAFVYIDVSFPFPSRPSNAVFGEEAKIAMLIM